MGIIQQISLGTILLALSALVHTAAIAASIPYFGHLSQRISKDHWPRLRPAMFLTFGICILVAAHTIQIWTWALVFLMIGSLPDFPTSFYFATVTYTTLGYGDIVLGADARIVATFCAITGLLTFGISTAYLIGILGRVLPKSFEDAP